MVHTIICFFVFLVGIGFDYFHVFPVYPIMLEFLLCSFNTHPSPFNYPFVIQVGVATRI